MQLKEWLDAERGRYVALAEHLGVSKSMVSQMACGHVRVPPVHYARIRDFTGGQVSIEDLLPTSTASAN